MTPRGQIPPTRAQAALARDIALARAGHTRRWVILGSAGLSAAFAALVSTSPPSKASTAATARTPASTAPQRTASVTRPGQAPALPPLAGGAQLGLQGPGQGPSSGDDSGQSAQPGPTQQQSQSAASAAAPSQPAPSPQPAPVSGGS